ncbi:MAG: glycolate oxidase subunit GlcE [Rhodocyclaceae bacterium]|nr:glycolate oxidase subunit GlcE [Rhodocyclaceae bacterium]MBX3668398.1 glycolate oxidase subunit GlcE [Rhodocyclaceae bacterium]
MNQLTQYYADTLRAAARGGGKVVPRGGGSKDFYGRATVGEILSLADYRGIINYDPTELVLTARAGTPLAEIEALLAEQNQCLAFEPPHFGSGATLGGAVAAGLSGPRRMQTGPLRDFVLGTKIMDGRGDILKFGGEVMKNVAGFDVSRLLAGSLGSFSLILEVSVKVLPRPPYEATLRMAVPEAEALARLNSWGGQPLPLAASAWYDGQLTLRLAGAHAAVDAACSKLGGSRLEADAASAFWNSVREQQDAFFGGGEALWRLAVPTTAAPLSVPGRQFIEWGGGLRWWKSDAPASVIRSAAQAVGGNATLFRGGDRRDERFTPLPLAQLRLHQGLKKAFDPNNVFDASRLYAELA